RIPPGRSRDCTAVGSEHPAAKNTASATLIDDVRERIEILVRRHASVWVAPTRRLHCAAAWEGAQERPKEDPGGKSPERQGDCKSEDSLIFIRRVVAVEHRCHDAV